MKLVPIIALVLSGVAVVIALTGSPADSTTTGTSNREVEEQLRRFDRRFTELEASQARLAQRLAEASGDGVEAGNFEELERVAAGLSGTQAELEALKRSVDPYGVIRATEQKILKARETLLDASRPAWERAKQARYLDEYGQFDAEAVAAMRDLLQSGEDPNARAAALMALKGHVTPGMRDDILATLGSEEVKSPRLTYYGIEALEPLLPDPVVEEWLTNVAESDPEAKIANRAAQSLGVEIEWESPPAKGR